MAGRARTVTIHIKDRDGFDVDNALGLVRKAETTLPARLKKKGKPGQRDEEVDNAGDDEGDTEKPRSLSIEDRKFGRYILLPPIDLTTLAKLPQESSILLQCIIAMMTNVDGHGWDLEYIGPPPPDRDPEELDANGNPLPPDAVPEPARKPKLGPDGKPVLDEFGKPVLEDVDPAAPASDGTRVPPPVEGAAPDSTQAGPEADPAADTAGDPQADQDPRKKAPPPWLTKKAVDPEEERRRQAQIETRPPRGPHAAEPPPADPAAPPPAAREGQTQPTDPAQAPQPGAASASGAQDAPLPAGQRAQPGEDLPPNAGEGARVAPGAEAAQQGLQQAGQPGTQQDARGNVVPVGQPGPDGTPAAGAPQLGPDGKPLPPQLGPDGKPLSPKKAGPPETGPESTAAIEEEKMIRTFIKTCNPKYSLDTIRQRLRMDIESTGNGYLELLRNMAGEIVGIEHVPSHTVRLTPLDRRPILVDAVLIGDEGEVVERRVWQRFRRFVQIQDGRRVYFKEAGDPRHISFKDGRELPEGWKPGDPNDFKTSPDQDAAPTDRTRTKGPKVSAATKFDELAPAPPIPGLDAGPGTDGEPDDFATELLHFGCVYNPISPYFMPRFIGNLPSIRGGRYAELVNLMFFRKNAIPSMIVAVSGGSLSDKSFKRIESYFEEEYGGVENSQRVLVLEANIGTNQVDGSSSAIKIDIKPMQGDKQSDAQWREYMKDCRANVRGSFRLPGQFVGEGEDSNFATAQANRTTVEEQVFQPERDAFDEIFNMRILRVLGVKYWRFYSRGPEIADVATYTAAMQAFSSVGAMTPNQAIELQNELLGTNLDPITEAWGDYPFPIVMGVLAQGKLRGLEEITDASLAPNPLDALMGGGGKPPFGGKPGGKPPGLGGAGDTKEIDVPEQGAEVNPPTPLEQAAVNAAAGLSQVRKMYSEGDEVARQLIVMVLQNQQLMGQQLRQLSAARKNDVAVTDLAAGGLKNTQQGGISPKVLMRRRRRVSTTRRTR